MNLSFSSLWNQKQQQQKKKERRKKEQIDRIKTKQNILSQCANVTHRINISIANKWNRIAPSSWKLNNSNNHKNAKNGKQSERKERNIQTKPNNAITMTMPNIKMEKWCVVVEKSTIYCSLWVESASENSDTDRWQHS